VRIERVVADRWEANYREIQAAYATASAALDWALEFAQRKTDGSSETIKETVSAALELLPSVALMGHMLLQFDGPKAAPADAAPVFHGSADPVPSITGVEDVRVAEQRLRNALALEFTIGREMVDLREQIGSARFPRELEMSCPSIPWTDAETFMSNALDSSIARRFDEVQQQRPQRRRSD
jgi:hypothetical protein